MSIIGLFLVNNIFVQFLADFSFFFLFFWSNFRFSFCQIRSISVYFWSITEVLHFRSITILGNFGLISVQFLYLNLYLNFRALNIVLYCRLPLIFVLGVTALKDIFEDRRRYLSDKRVNNYTCRVYKSNLGRYVKTLWKDVKVGDMVHLSVNEMIPADIIVLRSSDEHGLCYIGKKFEFSRAI